MFRQTGNSDADPSASGELLVTRSGGGVGSDVNLIEVGGEAIELGQAAMAASLPVVIASDQSAIPISGSVTTGGLTDAQLRATPVPISGTVTANAGTNLNTSALALETTLLGVLTSTNFAAAFGTAGTADSQVLSVQGIASMTPLQVVGNIAHDSADSGNPIKNGNKAVSFGSNPTEVAANDRTDAYATLAGIPFVQNGHPNVLSRRDNYTSAQTDTALITVSGGAKIVVLSCTIAADAANSVKPLARAGFGATNTPTGAGTYISHPGIPAGGGIREAGAVAGADGEDFRFTCAVPTGGSLDVVTKYYTTTA
jgi:hypothetical protein